MIYQEYGIIFSNTSSIRDNRRCFSKYYTIPFCENCGFKSKYFPYLPKKSWVTCDKFGQMLNK